jgi:CRISPR-associated endonuclease Cas1
MKEGYDTGIKADISAFFDSVDTQSLCDLFAGYFPYEPLGDFIRSFLTHAADSGIKGLPQGWSLSPVLSNLYLDRFDRMVETAGFRLVRFADDFVLLGKESGSPEAARQTAMEVLAKLGLTLKEEKIEPIEKGATIRFLGLAVTAGDVGDIPSEESHEEEPWAPMFRPEWRRGRPVYLSSVCRGAFSSGAALVVRLEDDQNIQIPWNSISRIVIAGRSQVSGGVLYRAVKEEVPVTFIDVMGRTRGHFRAEGVELVNERELQIKRSAEPAYCVSFAREIISAKITNSFVLLRRNSIMEPALKELASQATAAENLESLRGYEGAAARIYWQHFATLVKPFEFKGRSYHPPDGAINVMLSFGYTLLYNRISAALADQGFDPRVGLFHQGRGTHNALASDLQEELRHIADRVILALVHRKEINPEDFTITKNRDKEICRLGGEGFRRFIRRYETVMSAPFTREGAKTCYNEYLDDMAACLRRSMKLDLPYQALRIR